MDQKLSQGLKTTQPRSGTCPMAHILKPYLAIQGGITSVAISPDGSKIVTGSEDKTAKIWNMSDGSLIATLYGHKDTYMQLQ